MSAVGDLRRARTATTRSCRAPGRVGPSTHLLLAGVPTHLGQRSTRRRGRPGRLRGPQPGRDWIVRLRRGAHTVPVRRELGHFSAEALATELRYFFQGVGPTQRRRTGDRPGRHRGRSLGRRRRSRPVHPGRRYDRVETKLNARRTRELLTAAPGNSVTVDTRSPPPRPTWRLQVRSCRGPSPPTPATGAPRT